VEPDLLTIGAFAKASRLSIKALRLYDGLGLLRPARVDPVSGYRYYDPEQVERARLVLWLRRIGMPLAEIRELCEQPAAEAASLVRVFWARTEADAAVRRDLAAFLIDHLSRKDAAMPVSTAPMEIRYAASSDIGRVRQSNQDTAYAGPALLAVADGFGGTGEAASAAVVDALKRLEPGMIEATDLLNALQDAVQAANQAVHEIAAADTSGESKAGSTLTAMLWTGSQLALVHIGDSRVYLLRDREFFKITQDHTWVQSMVDEGRLSPEEATSHPHRALLLRALDGSATAAPELRLHGARTGDRYLLCTDGLSAVVPEEELQRVATTVADPDQAVRELIALADEAGGPDNIACVIADVIDPVRRSDRPIAG
jgi:PPM family protein phosphatase